MRLWSALGALLAITLAAPVACADESLGAAANTSGRYFGAAIDVGALSEQPYLTLVESQLTSATAENAMKWGEIETARGVFRWGPADGFVAFAKSRGQKIRGHNLVWHQQLPQWLIDGQFSASDVKGLMLAHIATEVGRYKGSIYAWDVINEPFAGAGEWRHSIFFDAMGSDYVALALRAAHEADPDAKLYINDYGVETAGLKTEALFNLVSALKREGVPLDGVGFQCHFVAGSAPVDLANVMRRFAALDVDVAVTELDLRIPLPATPWALKMQADDYASVVAACRSTPRCVGVTTWGVTDDRSWIPGFFSGYGAALPFDDQYRPKPAVSAMTKAFTAQPR